uniref:Ig-like domain-containing protein n=1 Tax=Timema shepardi TaxID=629360 RepID=A0A7R9B6T1_TIMSH|nr:unnamed protein product [Timema shepardi]
MTLSRNRLDEYSYQNGLILSKARKEALLNGNKLQLEMMRERLGLSEEEQAMIISVPIIPPSTNKEEEEEKERGEIEALIWVIEKDERVTKTKPEVLETNGNTQTDAHSEGFDVEEKSLDLDIKLVSKVEIKSRVETMEDERMMDPIIHSVDSEGGSMKTKGIFLEKLAKSPVNPSPEKIPKEAARVNNSSEKSLSEELYLNKLIISRTTEADSGYYVCLVASSPGYNFRGAYLTVRPTKNLEYKDSLTTDSAPLSLLFLIPAALALTPAGVGLCIWWCQHCGKNSNNIVTNSQQPVVNNNNPSIKVPRKAFKYKPVAGSSGAVHCHSDKINPVTL